MPTACCLLEKIMNSNAVNKTASRFDRFAFSPSRLLWFGYLHRNILEAVIVLGSLRCTYEYTRTCQRLLVCVACVHGVNVCDSGDSRRTRTKVACKLLTFGRS